MITRFLLPFFALAVPGFFGQISLYGPVTAHLKAGDQAPEIRFAEVLSTPRHAQWNQSRLTGQLTILIFYLNTSENLETITKWNSLVDAFAGQQVQFLLISGEQDRTLLPWLNQHPIKGWVFHDPDGESGRAYGLEEPATVFIGADGKILGFGDMGFPPQESEVKAALEGRITTTRPRRATIKAFLESGQVILNAEPHRMPGREDFKPKLPPSDALHVSISESEGSGNYSGPDFLSLRGYTLKAAIQHLYDVNPARVILPAVLDDGRRYDFAMVLPEPEDREKIKTRLEEGILDSFHLTAEREDRVVEAYVVTEVPGRKPPRFKIESEEGTGSSSGATSLSMEYQITGDPDQALDGMKPLSVNSLSSISIDGTADEFCHLLEGDLDRPVVNETNLQGEFRFHAERNEGAANNFLENLRDQLGLVIMPSTRNVEVLVFAVR